MSKRHLIKGMKVIAVEGNNEGLTVGSIYTITSEGHSKSIGWVDHHGKDKIVHFNGTKGQLGNDVEPYEAPVELPTPEQDAELVKHQQQTTRSALHMVTSHPAFRNMADPTVVGGAPRDWDYMIPAQDIDIWCKNILFGEEHLNALKSLFEPLGATVGKVTDNTYARDGEYIHYIFNVVWEGVDLQFIFVEDPSVEMVIKHVCCNFSEIAWDWRTERLQPSYKYKAGRMSKVLVFSDDKGRSPRDKYIEKMAKRYPDHSLELPKSCSHLVDKYEQRIAGPFDTYMVPDGTWGTKPTLVYGGGRCPGKSMVRQMQEDLQHHDHLVFVEWKTEEKPKEHWVVALESFHSTQKDEYSITKGKPYKVARKSGNEDYYLELGGGEPYYDAKRFRELELDEKVLKCVDTNHSNVVTKGNYYLSTDEDSDYFYITIDKGKPNSGMCKYRFEVVS